MWAIIVAAVIGPILTSILGRFLQVRLANQDGKIDEVHALVNSQLTTALDEIDSLKTQLRAVIGDNGGQ